MNDGYQQVPMCKNPKKQTDYYLTKKMDDKMITFVLQTGLKKYMNMKYNIPIFRYPDEAFIIEYDDGKITSNELKYVTLNHILSENGICVLFGCDENYFQMFDEWFNNSL